MLHFIKQMARLHCLNIVTALMQNEVILFNPLMYRRYNYRLFLHIRSAYGCTQGTMCSQNTEIKLPKPELDFSYLCNSFNKECIDLNIKKRKGVGNITRVQELYQSLTNSNSQDNKLLELELQEEALQIPNKSHPDILSYGDNPKVINKINSKKEFTFKPQELSELVKPLNLMRVQNLGTFSGHKSYYLLGDLAEMEQALIQFTVKSLVLRGFKLMTVPDILPRQIVESCGMKTTGDRTQVYELEPKRHAPDMILSGTSEMALAGYLINKVFSSDELPIRLVAVSRCYRAETSSILDERGIYRVHQFTKVEMFGVTDQESSESLLEEFRLIQEEIFGGLGLHLQTLDMPLPDLGAPAYRKYDVEAWMPGRGIYGEISSCSNCTDYQSRRLNVKYSLPGKEPVHVHTVNGTACAIPRMLIAALETYQEKNGTIYIPDNLQPFMHDKKTIEKQSGIPKFKLMKTKLSENNIIQESV